MNKDIPIIFSAPMVRALWDGKKTMTRRLLNPQPEICFDDDGVQLPIGMMHVEGDLRPRITVGRAVTKQEVRYAVGDRLWVRENYAAYWGQRFAGGTPIIGASVKQAGGHPPIVSTADDPVIVHYAATPEGVQTKWRPSIHQPRWASRLTLIVTAVKIERLQDISKADAIAEGATSRPNCSGFMGRYDGWSMDWSNVGKFSHFATGGPGPLTERDISLVDPIGAFGSYINQLHNGDRWNMPGKPLPIWDTSPYVAALTFTVHRCNIDALDLPQPAE